MAYKNKEQARAYARAHYKKNKKTYLTRNLIHRRNTAEYIRKAKEVPCADCSKRYPYYVMDFDHKDPTTKTANMSYMAHTTSFEAAKREIDKCEVVCANCHRMRTFAKFNPPKAA